MAKTTGIDIYKVLPRTNCGDCNVPTCMAFAMQVAAKKAALDQCPHVSADAQSTLGEAQAPPMLTIKIGTGDNELTVGGETVLFRHEEKFHHPTVVAVRISNALSDDEIDARLTAIGELHFLRVGEEIGVNAVAIDCENADANCYRSAVERISSKTELPLILLCEDTDILGSALEKVADRKPLIGPATAKNTETMAKLAADKKVPLLVSADGFEELAALTEQIKGLGVNDLVLQPKSDSLVGLLTQLTTIRRLALDKVYRPLGYPTLVLADGASTEDEALATGAVICRYASIVVTNAIKPWEILPQLTARQNIYTDPQVPNAIEATVYEIGTPGPDAPVLLTTNFALTYFTVAGEVENSKVPAYIAVVDTEGLGVLNAYADDKLTAEKVVKSLQKHGVMDKVSHNKLVIPGLVAVLRMEIEEESGWDVVIGPEDAAGIPVFLRTKWSV